LQLSLVSCPRNNFSNAFDLGNDRVGGSGPDERPVMGVVVSNELVNFLDQFRHVAEGTAADGALGYQAEPALHLVKPTGVGRGVMNLVAGMADQPGFDLGMFMRAVVVGNQMHLELGGKVLVQVVQKAQELLGGDDGACIE